MSAPNNTNTIIRTAHTMTALLHLYAIHSWCEHGDDNAPAEPSDIDAKQRRRLSALAKYALAARQSLSQHTDLSQVDHILWCSSFGDERKTLHILQDIAADETPSPTAFATSVHNATAGLYSMLYQDDVPSSSMNVGVTEFGNALVYAYALLNSHSASKVLVIAADEPLPALYQTQQPEQAYAMACVLGLGSEATPTNLRIVADTNNLTPPNKRPEALQFADFWQQAPTELSLGQWRLCKA